MAVQAVTGEYPPPRLHSLQDIEGYLSTLGIEVEYVTTFPRSQHGIPDFFDNQAYICVNGHDHPARQALTLLHELKHLIFDWQVIPVSFNRDFFAHYHQTPAHTYLHIHEEMFALYFLLLFATPSFQEQVLKYNPDTKAIFNSCLVMGGVGVVIKGCEFLYSKLTSDPSSSFTPSSK